MSVRRAIVFALSAAVISGCNSTGGQSALSSLDAGGAHHRASSSPIQHIVIIMQENRSFDNLFYHVSGRELRDARHRPQRKGLSAATNPLRLGARPEPLPLAVSRRLRQGQERRMRTPDHPAVLYGKGCTDGNWFNKPHCWHSIRAKKKRCSRTPTCSKLRFNRIGIWPSSTSWATRRSHRTTVRRSFRTSTWLPANLAHASEVPSQMPWGCDKPLSRPKIIWQYGSADPPPCYGPKVGHEYVGPYPCFPLTLRRVRRQPITRSPTNWTTPALPGAITSSRNRPETRIGSMRSTR